MSPTPEANAICIGRFSLVPPPGWALSGRSQKMYLTELDDALPPAPSSDDPMLERLRFGLPAKAPLIRRFDLEGVGPAAWFGLGAIDSVDRRLVGVAGPLRLQALATRGREPVAEKAMRMIAAGYRSGARTGFCLVRGAMQLDPSRHESTELNLQALEIPNASFVLSTRAVDKPEESHPLANPESEAAGMAGSGVTLKLSKPVERRVAGLPGREFRAEFQADGKDHRQRLYRYFYPGAARQATAPLMTLSLDGPASEQAALDKAWDALLDSLQPVPLR